MKAKLIIASMVVAISSMSAPAFAAGCLKGAAVGGVAGHVAGRHTLLGAAGGCLVGRHLANKKARQAHAATPATPATPVRK
jgi:hypothetical protein